METLNYDQDYWKQACPKVDCKNKKDCCCGLKYVAVPTSLGDDSKNSPVAPKNGAYCNALVVYEANGHVYIYSKEGIPTLIDVDASDISVLEQEVIKAQKDVHELREDIDDFIYGFDTVAQMKAATNLKSGDIVRTLGYYAKNDGGSAYYKISNTQPSGYYEILSNMLCAELVKEQSMNVKQFGAYGDNLHDDTTAITQCLAFARSHNLPVYVPAGEYIVSDEFNVNFAINIYGEGRATSKIKQTEPTKHIFIVPYVKCIIKDLCFESPDNSSVSMIQIKSSTGHNFSNIVENCEFIGTNKAGYGIDLVCTSTYGIMGNTIKDCVFRSLYNGIRFNIGNGWINGNYFNNLWFYTTVNGIEWADTESYKSCSSNKFDCIKGQYSSGSNSLIYNVNGSNNTFSDILLWDGGITIQIGYHARYTKIRNNPNFEINKFRDYGWHTEVDTFYGELLGPHFIEKNLTFLTDTDGMEAKTTNGNEPVVGIISNNPACSVSTVATTNDTIALQGKGFTLLGTGKQMISFSFRVDNIENIKLYLGMATSVYNQNQGNFLTFDTSVDYHPALKAIGNEGTGTYSGTLTIPSFTLNTSWHKIQIWRNQDSRLDVWIDGAYIGGFDSSQKYNQTPFFKIQTLDANVKTLSIGQVRIKNYVY